MSRVDDRPPNDSALLHEKTHRSSWARGSDCVEYHRLGERTVRHGAGPTENRNI